MSSNESSKRIIRHSLSDRAFHWVSAVCMLVLMVTGLFPVLGIEFSWLTIHWIAGLVFTALVIWHTVRTIMVKDRTSMSPKTSDVTAAIESVKLGSQANTKPGKYSFEQKMMHNAVTLFSLIGIITGILMLLRIDTPWWQANPYWISSAVTGIVFVLHGVVALFFITLIMIHVYFSLRPEKRLYLRSMIKGWVTREELEAHHDPEKWQADG